MRLKFLRLCLAVHALILPSLTGAEDIQTYADLESAYARDLLTFGFVQNGEFYADLTNTIWPRPTWLESLVQAGLGSRKDERGIYFHPFPFDSLPQDYQSIFNDTLKILWSGGVNRAVIRAIGWHESTCYGGPVYALALTDTVRKKPDWFDVFTLIHDSVRIPNHVTSYISYEVEDESLLKIIQDLHGRISDSNSCEYPHDPIESYRDELRGKANSVLPDTLILSVHGSNGSTEWTWVLIELFWRDNGHWVSRDILPLRKGSYVFWVEAMFDVEGDGVFEYLVNLGGTTAIYSLREGLLVPRIVGINQGC